MADVSSPLSFKRRRLSIGNIDHTAAQEIQVFQTSSALTSSFHNFQQSTNAAEDSSDQIYELAAADYFRISNTKNAEETERRSRTTKDVKIRVRFPDNHTLEATFRASDKIQCLVDHLKNVVGLPFYLFTAPPKMVITDMSQDFYSAGFVPGAIVYLSYDVPK